MSNGNGTPNEQELRERYKATLVAFTLRARRVEAHSLAQDRDALLQYARVAITVRVEPQTGKAVITRNVPPEEQIESAAARLRPLILQDEQIHHSAVTTAIGFLLKEVDDPRIRELLSSLKNEWKTFNPRGTNVSGYSLQIQNAEGRSFDAVADNVMAFAWLYGDVVHADPQRLAETEHVGIEERYQAATAVVCRLMVQTIATLNFIRQLRQLLDLPDFAFEREVVATHTEFSNEGRVYMADVTEGDGIPALPPLGEVPTDSAWRTFDPREFLSSDCEGPTVTGPGDQG